MKAKRKQQPMSKEEYIETFCVDKRVRDRMAIYVSEKTHRKIRLAAITLNSYYVTTASLVDTILSHHLETHKELLKELEKEDWERVMNVGQEESGDESEENQ